MCPPCCYGDSKLRCWNWHFVWCYHSLFSNFIVWKAYLKNSLVCTTSVNLFYRVVELMEVLDSLVADQEAREASRPAEMRGFGWSEMWVHEISQIHRCLLVTWSIKKTSKQSSKANKWMGQNCSSDFKAFHMLGFNFNSRKYIKINSICTCIYEYVLRKCTSIGYNIAGIR